MINKPILILDLDDTILDLVPKWIEAYNSENDDNLKVSDIRCWDIEKFTKIPYNELIKIVIQNKLYENLPIKENAYDVIKWAIQYYDVQICTSVVKFTYDMKIDWIEKHLPFFSLKNFNSIHNKYIIRGDIMLDDRESNLENNFIKNPYIFKAPWNQYQTKYKSVNDWIEFEKILRDYL